MDRSDAPPDLEQLIQTAIARAHARAEAEPPPPPHGLGGLLRRLLGRPSVRAMAHAGEPEAPRAYLAVWCDGVEPLGAAQEVPRPQAEMEHPHALAHGHLPEGGSIRWVAEPGQAEFVEEEFGAGREPVAVSIGSWQRV